MSKSGKWSLRAASFVLMIFCGAVLCFGQQGPGDPIVQAAIKTIRAQARLSQDTEIKFLEKRESQLTGFYAVKLLLTLTDQEIPIIVYVDKTGEKIILGNLFIKGENVSQKEAGVARRRKVDPAQLEMEKSPFRGSPGAKMKIVEFSNFECPFCQQSWMKTKEWMEKHPADIHYVFKHYSSGPQGEISDFSEMAAAAQEIGNEAFWLVHDFFFSNEGQVLTKGERGQAKERIEQILKEKGYDVEVFRSAMDTGKAKKRVEEDTAKGKKIKVHSTPTTFVNGDVFVGAISDLVFQEYLGKK